MLDWGDGGCGNIILAATFGWLCCASHNHPSGVAEPSQADRLLTDQLVSALAMVEVTVVDHLVVGDGDCVSFVDLGLL